MKSACAVLPYVARPFYQVFKHYLINGTILEKVILHKMHGLIFSATFVSNLFHSKENSAKYHK
jgi:hypothetical protein